MKEEVEDVIVVFQTKEEKKFKDLKEYIELQKQATIKECQDKFESFANAKVSKESERSMNEMCSMIEELARLVKSLEWQFQTKRTEQESTLLNVSNLQRRMDEY